jgi:omega-6 fatty acid desaturase (delta-12 desaturase)
MTSLRRLLQAIVRATEALIELVWALVHLPTSAFRRWRPSRKANDALGLITGMLSFTPYYHWRWEHALHHASAGDLDRRGTGDVWTLTAEEYLEASRWTRFAYRLMRNPVSLLVVAPRFLMLILHRFPSPGARRREVNSVYGTTFAGLAMVVGLSWLFGLTTYLLLLLGVLMIAGSAGVWLFYVQHQFEGVYWERHGKRWRPY